MLSAENGALPGGKVGGVGDVIRDLPVALASRGWQPCVLTPAYGIFAELPGAKRVSTVEVGFGGEIQVVDLLEIPGPHSGVRHFALDHPLFSPREPGEIYCDDGPEAPFATDAGKFAFFCAATACALTAGALKPPQIIHLHDWQAALLLVLREFDPACRALKTIRTVFTIHNLAFQGVRPLAANDSSLEAWFPRLKYEASAVADPRWVDCVNPMAAAIRLADGVSTVSPTYAREILEPNAPERGFFGGEGLEADLGAAHAKGRLVGILNGCNYPPERARKPGWKRMREAMSHELALWIARESPMASAHFLAHRRLTALPARRPGALLTSIGRIGAQKLQLFREQTTDGSSALEAILERLGDGGLFVMLGDGDPEYEEFLAETGATHENFLFLRGYSDRLSRLLYSGGDLFLMPSSFEPCGISQMLAMRAGQPCVVHGVGGLKDTVGDNINGFVFRGATRRAQATNLVSTVANALELRSASSGRWRRIQEAASETRFSWEASAVEYETRLYGLGGA